MRISDWSSDVCSSDLPTARCCRISRDRRANCWGGKYLRHCEEPKATRHSGACINRAGLIEPSLLLHHAPDKRAAFGLAVYGAICTGRRRQDRKRVEKGKSVSVRVPHAGRRILKTKRNN